MKKSLRQQVLDYRPEKGDVLILIKGLAVIGGLAWFFYRSALAVILLSPLLVPFFLREKRLAAARRSHLIGIQFRDAILAVANCQRAGYSVENAFAEARKDMTLLYGGGSLIVREFSRIEKGLMNNITPEQLLTEMGERSGNDDIREFARVFAVAKKSGGNMTQMIGDTAELIGDRLRVENEIDVLLAARRMEARIMEVVPFFIIFYVGLTSPGFFDPLYHSFVGIVVMSVCLAVYLFAYLLSEKIISVEV